jgi:two-component system sensor histidine kinase CiaH
MFHSAALKLTTWYLAIILALSVSTSLVIYRTSSADLNHNNQRQVGYFNNFLRPIDINNYSVLRQNQLDEDKQHLKDRLVLFNIFILVGGGVISYALARRTLEPIEEALESQKRFTGDASHELRTPLTAMQTEIEVALRDKNLSKKEATDLLRSNLEEVSKLKALSEGLLQLASANTINTSQAVSAKEVVATAVSRAEKAAKFKDISLIVSGKDLTIRGNQESLVDLVSILLDNAIKYSHAGTKVSITSSKNDKTGLISVTDQGQGIEAGDLPHIFERFYRADTSRHKADTGGYGLGLAIAKRIADIHNGSIEVKSTPNKGSSFNIHIPLA